MFEQNIPSNLPVPDKVEDIFAPTHEIKSRPSSSPAEPVVTETPKTGFKRVLAMVILIVVLGGGAVFGYTWFKNYKLKISTSTLPKPTGSTTPSPVSEPNTEKGTGSSPAVVSPQPREETSTSSQVVAPLDSDGDGLTDDEELKIYHTNPLDPDTDHDGLTDREEVKVYHTDPLNPDTDHDGYQDGHEVQNGYNPNGPGKLLPQVPGSSTR